MGRSNFRNLWLLVVLILMGSSYFLFQKAQETLVSIERSESRLIQLRRERNNVENLSAALAELDSLTIDEKSSTRLDILRHLNLEDKEYEFILRSREAEQVGDSMLYIRQFDLSAMLPYAAALRLLDELHTNKKTAIHRFELESSIESGGENYGDYVKVIAGGSLYGLDKQ